MSLKLQTVLKMLSAFPVLCRLWASTAKGAPISILENHLIYTLFATSSIQQGQTLSLSDIGHYLKPMARYVYTNIIRHSRRSISSCSFVGRYKRIAAIKTKKTIEIIISTVFQRKNLNFSPGVLFYQSFSTP